MLHFSEDLLELPNTAASIFDIAPNSPGPITWDVTGYQSGPRGFFNVSEFPGRTTADFASDEPEVEEPQETYIIETLTAISYPLTANQSVPVSFQLLDAATSDPSAVNGTVTFRLVDGAGVPPGATPSATARRIITVPATTVST